MSRDMVQLPPITAAQRQELISVLDIAARGQHRRYAARIVALAHALELHQDATPVENAAPGQVTT